MWTEIQRKHTKRNAEDFVTYFEKSKLIGTRKKITR